MTDDRLELPLFDPPDRDSEEDLDSLFDERRPAAPNPQQSRSPQGPQAPQEPAGVDDPIVIEPIEVPQGRETTAPEAAGSGPGTPEVTAYSAPQPAGVGTRLAAGLIDLLVHVALVGVLIGGSSLLGAAVGWQHIVPLAFVTAIFSFVYHVVPLAFWGRTPGMAVAGLRARTLDDEPLSLPQATKHWLALVLTAATGGLGVLLALGGRSLADRLSGSRTLLQ